MTAISPAAAAASDRRPDDAASHAHDDGDDDGAHHVLAPPDAPAGAPAGSSAARAAGPVAFWFLVAYLLYAATHLLLAEFLAARSPDYFHTPDAVALAAATHGLDPANPEHLARLDEHPAMLAYPAVHARRAPFEPFVAIPLLIVLLATNRRRPPRWWHGLATFALFNAVLVAGVALAYAKVWQFTGADLLAMQFPELAARGLAGDALKAAVGVEIALRQLPMAGLFGLGTALFFVGLLRAGDGPSAPAPPDPGAR